MLKRLLLIVFVGITSTCSSNNLAITNVGLTGQNTVSDYTLVQFDISWDNSWRTSTLESNWDAAWVFVKWRKQGSKLWDHATLNTSGHTAPSGSTIDTPSDGMGVFIYKSANAIGTNSWAGVKLRWNYGADGALDADLVEVKVFAIEMVYIPTASFYVGDGSVTTLRGQFEDRLTTNPVQITSENALTLGGGGVGSIGNNNTSGEFTVDDYNDVTAKALPAAFPKGYSKFYIMKYEVTQQQCVEFLNTLTYTQQATRTAVAPSSAAGTGALSNTLRNGIDIKTPGTSTVTPAVYACNLDGDAIYDETVDGQNIACNFFSWPDCAAYLDWAALRPMTELEYEKACRGTDAAVADEYAWGSTSITAATGITNSGANNEIASNAAANVTYSNAASVQGPMRVGCFAGAATTRAQAGASYYGVLDLSGNVMERPVSTSNATGRAFTGVHGDGVLTSAGDGNTANWPGTGATGSCYRGGDWARTTALRVSDRYMAGYSETGRFKDGGGRGVRTAP